MQDVYFEYILELVENLPKRYRDEVVSEVYVHIEGMGVDLDSKPNARKYIYNLVYKKSKALADSRGQRQLVIDVPDKPEPLQLFKLRLDDLEAGIQGMKPKLQAVIRESIKPLTQDQAAANLGMTQGDFSRTRKEAIRFLSNWVKRNLPDFQDLL